MTHAKLFSPSASSRWLNCTASPLYIEDLKIRQIIPKEPASSPAAAEGTLAHRLLEQWIKAQDRPDGDIDMLECVRHGVDYAMQKEMDGYIVASEIKLPIPQTGDIGTADLLLYHPKTKHLIVADYKHGFNFVDVVENTQGLLYALGAVNKLLDKKKTVKRVTIAIIQPRVYGHDPIREWSIDVPMLKIFADRVRETVTKIKNKHGTFAPSEKACQWCPAAAYCTARAKAIASEFDENADVVTADHLPHIEHLSDAQVAGFMQHLPLISGWINDIEKRAYGLAVHNKLTGFKLVEGRATRKWNEENKPDFAAYSIDIDDYMPRTLVGITEGQKLIPAKERKEFMDRHTVKGRGKPVLVPESDKREAMQVISVDDYAGNDE